MGQKTEKPTNKRLKDSAKKGQSFKSKDLITTLVLLVGVYYLAGGINFRPFISFYSMLLLYNNGISIKDFLLELTRLFFQISLPFIAVCSVGGAVTTLLQTRFSIATEALKLNFKALNPVEGAKKLFSMRTIKELVKSVLYLMVFLCSCYILMKNNLKVVLALYKSDIPFMVTSLLNLTVKAVFTFIAWSVFVLVADYIIEYFLHFKDLKMEKHEVKQERKENDGNPQIKSARRQAHIDLLSGEEMAAIRNSEVVMANPTHIAVAIYFNPEVASLPFIAFRSTNLKAKAAIAYAEKNGIPVVRNISLARRLYYAYSQYSFISMNDDALMDVMDVLIWLRQVESAGLRQVASVDTKAAPVQPESLQDNAP